MTPKLNRRPDAMADRDTSVGGGRKVVRSATVVGGRLQPFVGPTQERLLPHYSVGMLYGVAALSFEWDARKAAANRRKHGVTFEEAQTVFLDEEALVIGDEEEGEDRFLILGLSAGLRTLVVCHCYRSEVEVIRIISARRASRAEQRQYERRRR